MSCGYGGLVLGVAFGSNREMQWSSSANDGVARREPRTRASQFQALFSLGHPRMYAGKLTELSLFELGFLLRAQTRCAASRARRSDLRCRGLVSGHV